MSGVSKYRDIYDQYAVEHFNSNGWYSYIVGSGRWVCDVIAVKENDVAIVEVKSPAEKSCVSTFNDVNNMDPSLLRTLPLDFKNRRLTIYGGIKNTDNLGIKKLYAVTIGCQLFRYFHEFRYKIHKHQKSIEIDLVNRGNFNLIPIMAVPVEHKSHAEYALRYVKDKGFIHSYSNEIGDKLFVTSVAY